MEVLFLGEVPSDRGFRAVVALFGGTLVCFCWCSSSLQFSLSIVSFVLFGIGVGDVKSFPWLDHKTVEEELVSNEPKTSFECSEWG